MRGRRDPRATMLAFVDMEERVPTDHPIRTVKIIADEALERLSPEFDQMYSKVGRASVPPERLLKASLLISLYSVRSELSMSERNSATWRSKRVPVAAMSSENVLMAAVSRNP